MDSIDGHINALVGSCSRRSSVSGTATTNKLARYRHAKKDHRGARGAVAPTAHAKRTTTAEAATGKRFQI